MARTSVRAQRGGGRSWRPARTGLAAFTLIELLVVISIIAALMAVLVPVLILGKESANITQCLANLRELTKTATLYTGDNDPTGYGSYPTQPWHLGYIRGGITVMLVSEWVYGGFQPAIPHPDYPDDSDWYMFPTETRPYTKYIAPGAAGRHPIKSFICPSDRSHVSGYQGEYGEQPEVEERHGAWEVSGNSFPILWHWYEDAMYDGVDENGGEMRDYSDIDKMSKYGSLMLKEKSGGLAAEFVIFLEDMMDAYMMDARPPDGSEGESQLEMLGMGWHRKFSTYSMGFLDGHATHQYIDTRFSRGPGWNIRPGP